MQSRRREIIEILKRRGSTTVDELSRELGLTSVTVRHHLDVLRSEGLVSAPEVKHRNTSGRPQHTYSLTAKAQILFPHQHDSLAQALLEEIKLRCTDQIANAIFAGAAARLVADAPCPKSNEPIPTRAQQAVNFLNEKGYVAQWEQTPEGLLLHTCNCPFTGLAEDNPELCAADLRLMTALLGVELERVSHIAKGGGACSYCASANN